MLPMWLADMDFPTAPPIIAALSKRVAHGIFGYATYGDDFYEAIATWSRQRHGWEPKREWIVAGSGVMPAINLLIQTLTARGDGVIVQPPVFHPITEAVVFNDRQVRNNPLLLAGGRYEVDLERLESLAADPTTKMMILCSPHNPVGRVWTIEELRAVVGVCATHDVVVVSDEIHGDLTHPPASFVSAGALGEEYHGGLVVCTGPSKAFNLPGLKMALTILPNEAQRKAYLTTLRNQNELWGANPLGAVALEAAYRDGGPWLDALMDYLAGNIAYVESFIATRLPQLGVVKADALYLMWIDCRQLDRDSTELDALLRDAGLWVEQGATYGEEGEGFIRMTVACTRAVLEEAMERLARAVATG